MLDDVTDYKQVKPYLPPESSRFKVLITTRFQLGSSINQLSLDVLKPKEAMDLLKSLVQVGGSDRTIFVIDWVRAINAIQRGNGGYTTCQD